MGKKHQHNKLKNGPKTNSVKNADILCVNPPEPNSFNKTEPLIMKNELKQNLNEKDGTTCTINEENNVPVSVLYGPKTNSIVNDEVKNELEETLNKKDKKPTTCLVNNGNSGNGLVFNDAENYDSIKKKYKTEKLEKETRKDIFINELDVQILMNNLKLKKHEKTVERKNERLKNRDYYLHYICQVCKTEIETADRCAKCHMIAYCCTEHRRQHWPVHADLCTAIQDACKLRCSTHVLENGFGCKPEEFKKFCYNLMVECQSRVQRKLEQWEIELFLYPNVCETCYQFKHQNLISCKSCHHRSYCEPKHQKKNHNTYCKALTLYSRFAQHTYKNGIVEVSFPDTYVDKEINISGDMFTLLSPFAKDLRELEFLQLSELATAPLTALYSLQQFNKTSNTKFKNNNIIMHVVGAENHFEVNMLEKWEVFFLHYLPEILKLNIIFIGPELDLKQSEILKLKQVTLCKKCTERKRSLNFGFIPKTLYHEFTLQTPHTPPHIICAFNAGIYRSTGYNEEDTWKDTITEMYKQTDVPVLITEYTSAEALKDLKRIMEIQKVQTIKPPIQNSFASLKPSLNFVSYEEVPVIYKNYYLLLLKRK